MVPVAERLTIYARQAMPPVPSLLEQSRSRVVCRNWVYECEKCHHRTFTCYPVTGLTACFRAKGGKLCRGRIGPPEALGTIPRIAPRKRPARLLFPAEKERGCPTCCAVTGDPCRTKGGAVAQFTHATRERSVRSDHDGDPARN